MTHTVRIAFFVIMVSAMIVGMSLMGCVPGGTPPPTAAPESLAAAHLTRTAEAAAVQTIEAALAAEAITPTPAESAEIPTFPPTATPMPQPTNTPTLEPRPTLVATPLPTETPTATSTPKVAQRLPGRALMLIPVVESPHPYPNEYDESWLVSNLDAEAPATRLHFARLELEEEVDWLIILDPQDVEIQRLTGFYPDGVWTDPVPGTLMKLRLITDTSVQHWGFAVDAVETASYTSLAYTYSPHPYPNSAELKWSFTNTDLEAEGTRLHFSRIELEENVDWLALMDLTETPYQWITGHHPDGLWTMGVPGNGVIVKLFSDGSVNDWGFNLDALESASPEEAQPRPQPEKAMEESKHPYEQNMQQNWTLVNPNPAAAFSKVHFTRLDLSGGDSLILYDGNDNRIRIFYEGTHRQDFWSDDIPGRIVKVQLNSNDRGDLDWGFRIDRMVDGEAQVGLAESPHPYHQNWSNTWTLVNPNPAAAFSKVHFTRLDLSGGDSLILYDGNDNRIRIFYEGTHRQDFWSDDIPGRIVKVQLNSNDRGDLDWGFRIDDIAPKAEETPVPAFVNAVYLYIGQPGNLSLNGVPLGWASAPGDYRIQLPDVGEQVITVESLFHRQEITVRTDEQGNVEVEYQGIEVNP